MHITLETDYAIRIVDLLTKKRDRLDAGAISEATGVPQTFALKILRKLKTDNIVNSYKGTKGGYELAPRENPLTVYDVVETMEGVYMFSRCLEEGYCCNRTEAGLPCTYRIAFARVSDLMCEELKKLKFEDLSK